MTEDACTEIVMAEWTPERLKRFLTRAGKEVVALTDAEVGEAIQVADYDQLTGLVLLVKMSPESRARVHAAAREKQPA